MYSIKSSVLSTGYNRHAKHTRKHEHNSQILLFLHPTIKL